MKVVLVHDYIKEYGGAERVLKTLTEIYPKAPIYTAFRVAGSTADRQFKDKKIIESKFASILKLGKLYSPLRFLAPTIWRGMDLSKYDLVITSCSWYITRGFKIGPKTKVVAYCHTPPRWLYGYETSVGFTRYWPVKIYAAIVGHFLRIYDYKTAQDIDCWIANSKNVSQRIRKFYRKKSVVIYPPIDTKEIGKYRKYPKKDYYLIVSRLVGAKGIEEATRIFKKLDKKLIVVGEQGGFKAISDEEKYKLMAGAKAFVALAKQEDFGMTVVEAQAAGTPVIAFNGGGFKESVIDGVSGVFINKIDNKSLKKAIERIEKTKWDREKIVKNARRFSKERFKKEIERFVKNA